MRSSTLIAAFAVGLALATDPVPGTTGELGPAAIVESNPKGVTYQAILPNKNTTGVRGYIAGTSKTNGTGVVFNINFYGFPDFETLGPFSELPRLSHRSCQRLRPSLTLAQVYHIHDQPVSADGNCTTTKAHLDPYIRGEKPPCDPKDPANCQVGDLSGKHGNITANPFQVT